MVAKKLALHVAHMRFCISQRYLAGHSVGQGRKCLVFSVSRTYIYCIWPNINISTTTFYSSINTEDMYIHKRKNTNEPSVYKPAL